VGRPPEPGEAPEPARGEGEALVEVLAVPLNPIDINIGAGRFYGGSPPLPYVPGREGVGRVLEGEALAPGTLVWLYGGGGGLPSGALAERVAVPESAGVALPEGTDPAVAGALGIAGLAGWLPLAHRAPLREGETVLVLGATGTVGLVAVQGARLLGAARVVAAGRRREALERARRLGADAVVSLENAAGDLTTAFLEACGGERPTYVIDPLWGEPVVAAAAAAAQGARIVNIGQSAGAEAPLRSADVRGKQLDVLGFSIFHTPRDALEREYLRLVGHVAAGELEVELERFPLERVAEAWERQAQGAGAKVVVEVAPA
jgi:NADPH2:quinone reductase